MAEGAPLRDEGARLTTANVPSRPRAAPDAPLEFTIEHLNAELDLLREKNREYALLFQVLRVLHGSLELDAIMRFVLTAVTAGSALGFNRGLLFLTDAAGEHLIGRAGLGPATGEEAGRIWRSIGEQSFTELAVSAGNERPRATELDRVAAQLSFSLTPGSSVFADVVNEGHAVVVADAGSDPRVPPEFIAAFPTRSFLVAPVCSPGHTLGVIVADNYYTGRRIRDEDVMLLAALGEHAGLALDKAQVYTRLAQRLEERSTIHEVSKGILTTIDLETELATIARISAQVIGARGSVVWLLDEGEALKVAATFGAGAELAGGDETGAVADIAGKAVADALPVIVPVLAGGEASSLLCVPLLVRGRPIGAITVFGKVQGSFLDSPVFTVEDQEFLAILADQAAIAIENARLFVRLRETEERLREGEAIRARTEKLAALGEMSAKVAHEIRNPLASIGGFARRLIPHFAPGTRERQAVEVIVSETERLERILTTQLEFAQLSPPVLVPTDLNKVVEHTVLLILHEAQRRRVRMQKRLEPALPELLLDADRIKQVLLNLFQNGIQSLPDGGRMRIETSQHEDQVFLEVATDGEPIPGEMVERLFVPFATSRRAGSGLGLPVALKLVREHGGQIRVRSEGEWGAIFTVVLPVPGNEDRRHGADRRLRFLDRRNSTAGADAEAANGASAAPEA